MRSQGLLIANLLCSFLLVACGDSNEAPTIKSPNEQSEQDKNDDSNEKEKEQEQTKTAQEQIIETIKEETYKTWLAEPAVHSSTGTSPHGQVRTYFNEKLVESITNNNNEHTVGSISFKELYAANGDLTGFAAAVKIKEGPEEDSWYWYEVLKLDGFDDPDYEGNGLAACAGCHASSAVSGDYISSKLPEQIML